MPTDPADWPEVRMNTDDSGGTLVVGQKVWATDERVRNDVRQIRIRRFRLTGKEAFV
jgi:hypothetical protein